jgi:Arginase family
MRLRLLDLDGAVVGQPPFAEALGGRTIDRIAARDLGPKLRIVASRAAWTELGQRLPVLEPGQPEVTFYGSGDFHHVTTALVARWTKPITILHFDNHPDWVRWPQSNNCGSWVCRALELPQVVKVITLGPTSSDLVRPQLQLADLQQIRSGRLEVYPWRHAPSRVFKKFDATPCCAYRDGHLHWRQLADVAWEGFIDDMIAKLPTRDVWITIDKDVLAPNQATTNWDQGAMPLSHILTALERLHHRCNIVGVDVCGDYSPPEFSTAFQAVLAYFDHPAASAPSLAALAINAATNASLLDCLSSMFNAPHGSHGTG